MILSFLYLGSDTFSLLHRVNRKEAFPYQSSVSGSPLDRFRLLKGSGEFLIMFIPDEIAREISSLFEIKVNEGFSSLFPFSRLMMNPAWFNPLLR